MCRSFVGGSFCIAMLTSTSMCSLAAQERPPDILVVSAQADAPRDTALGGAAGADWVRTVGVGSGVQAGGQWGSLAGAWWTYGRFGGFTRQRALVLSAVGDLGRWHAAAATSPYWRYSTSVAAPLRPRLGIDGEFQQFRAASARQRLFRVGSSVHIGEAVDVKGSYFLITGDGSSSPAVSARVDVRFKDRQVMAGATLSRRAVAQPILSSEGVPLQTSQEWFAGWTTPLRSSTLVTAVSLMRSDVSRVLRAQVAIRIPLESKP